MEEIDTYIAKLIEDARERFAAQQDAALQNLFVLQMKMFKQADEAIEKWNAMVDVHGPTFERWDFIDPPKSIGCRKI